MISYRRSDSSTASHWLAKTLREQGQQVFIDADIEAGDGWRDVIVEHVRGAGVVLAMIGAGWARETIERDRDARRADDVLRLEIETALMEGVPVIPVCVDGAPLPLEQEVARPFRPLLGLQCAELRSACWDEDVARLVEKLAHASQHPPAIPELAPAGEPVELNGHHTYIRELAGHLADGKLVTVLGPQSNEGPELARRLVDEFRLPLDVANLAWVSQQVFMGPGRTPLCEKLREEMRAVVPNAVHRFLAELPQRLRASGRNGAQLIITTNYDTALEREFDRLHEPYDLAIFVACGLDRGRFVHVPWWDPEQPGPTVISAPGDYTRFPFDLVLNIDRTVIVKLHGGTTEPALTALDFDENFVVTEDDYIAFLAQSPIDKILPAQLLSKIRRSHFLFLGYPLREWHVRVFLQRVWDGQPFGSRSTVVAPSVGLTEAQRWNELRVNVVEEPLADFARKLAGLLAAGEPVGAA